MKEKSNTNKTRIISAIILIPIVAAVLIFGNKYIVDVLCSILAMLALKEYFNANKNHPKEIRRLRVFV